MPGINISDINLVVRDGNLELSAHRKKVHEDTRRDLRHSIERSTGEFKRDIALPSNTLEETISAILDNGVLTVSIDKKTPNQKVEL